MVKHRRRRPAWGPLFLVSSMIASGAASAACAGIFGFEHLSEEGFEAGVPEGSIDGGADAPPFEGDHSKAYVKRTGTMNGIATGLSTIVPSGYGKANRKAARYSSSGRASGVPIRSPLMAQVSDDSDAHHGVLAGGTHSGTLAGFGGTSIAAPEVANQLARILSTPCFVAAQLKQFVGQNGAVTVQLSGRSGQTPPGGATQVGPIDVLPPQTSQDERLGYGTIDPPPPDRRGIAKI